MARQPKVPRHQRFFWGNHRHGEPGKISQLFRRWLAYLRQLEFDSFLSPVKSTARHIFRRKGWRARYAIVAAASVVALSVGGGVSTVVYQSTVAPQEQLEDASAHTTDITVVATCPADSTGFYDLEVTLELKNVPQGQTATVEWRLNQTGSWTTQATGIVGNGKLVHWVISGEVLGTTKGNSPRVDTRTTWKPDNVSYGSDGWASGLKGDCVPTDAAASVAVGSPTCDAPAPITPTLVHATWATTPPTTPGQHSVVANAESGHKFANGKSTMTVTYTIPDKLNCAPEQELTCERVIVDYMRALKNGDHINLEYKVGNGSSKQVNVYVDQNVPGGYTGTINGTSVNQLGLRFSDGTTAGLSEADILAGIINFAYADLIDSDYYTVTFVQSNETDTWPNLTCGSTKKVSVTTPPFADKCGTADDIVSAPADTAEIDYEKVDSTTITAALKNPNGTDFNPLPAGWVLGQDGKSATYTAAFTDEPCPIVVTPEKPVALDLCGVSNDAYHVPSDKEGVIYTVTDNRVDGVGDVIVDAAAKSAYAIKAGEETHWVFSFTNVKCPDVPVLDGSTATGVCEANAPWISYSVVLSDADNQATSHEAHLLLSDQDGHSADLTLGNVVDNGNGTYSLAGKVLWPGATVDGDGNATGWPGWELVDGVWHGPSSVNEGWVRGDITAVLSVNPQLTVDLSYPDATPDCDGPKVITVKPALTLTPPTCDAAGSLKSSLDVEGLTGTWNKEPNGAGTYTRTWVTNPGYMFPDGSTVLTATKTVLGKVTGPSCGLASTGVDAMVVAGGTFFAVILVALGVMTLMWAQSRRRNNETSA